MGKFDWSTKSKQKQFVYLFWRTHHNWGESVVAAISKKQVRMGFSWNGKEERRRSGSKRIRRLHELHYFGDGQDDSEERQEDWGWEYRVSRLNARVAWLTKAGVAEWDKTKDPRIRASRLELLIQPRLPSRLNLTITDLRGFPIRPSSLSITIALLLTWFNRALVNSLTANARCNVAKWLLLPQAIRPAWLIYQLLRHCYLPLSLKCRQNSVNRKYSFRQSNDIIDPLEFNLLLQDATVMLFFVSLQ